MDNHKISTVFHQLWTRSHKRRCKGGEQPESQYKQELSPAESRILDIERAKRTALLHQAERTCDAVTARHNAVLERAGLPVQGIALSSPPASALSRRTKRPRVGRCPLFDVPPLNVEDIDRNQKSPGGLDEEDDSFWDQVALGSQLAVLACEEVETSSLSSVDSHMPRELRDLPLIRSPVDCTAFKPAPTPPHTAPPARRRESRLPVPSTHREAADNNIVNASQLRLIKNKAREKLARLKLDFQPSPQPPATARKSPEELPLAPTPPTAPPPKQRATRTRNLVPTETACEAGKETGSNCTVRATSDADKVELQPLDRPVEDLSRCFKMLSSDNWVKKMEGLKAVQALAQHHSEILKTKLHEVCLVVTEEVKNLRSAVACAAMKTLAEMYVHLQQVMDPEVEATGGALLLKLAQTRCSFIHQQANLALDAMVENCSHARIVSALLNTGLCHRCAAVRGSAAQHLHLLADHLGADHILTAGKTITERFLTAVAKMCVDAAPEARHHGQKMLHELAVHKDFLKLWQKIVPEKERQEAEKILKNTH